MHYKKRKLHKLHSIPIGLCNKEKLYLVSYSIPLSCMVVLLLGLGMMINPGLFLVDKSSAITIQDEWVVKDNGSSANSYSDSSTNIKNEKNNSNRNTSNTPETSDNVDTSPIDNAFGGFGGDEAELPQEDNDASIMPLAEDPYPSTESKIVPSLTLSISKTTVETSTVQGGNTAYAANNVTLSGSYVKDYTLSIKAGSANLTMPSGANSSTSTISGVGSGTVGSSMSANKWGYAVAETSNTNYAGLTYKTTPTNATTILSGAGNTESSTSMNVSKQLVFAAKFGDEATPGKYSASITLSATATPKALTMSNITDMQDMTPEICANSSAGQTAALKDNRGTSPISYKIIKMNDGTCWMAENLRLMNTTINSTNSDMASGSFTIPASSTSNFGSGMSTTDGYAPHAYYNNDTVYGAYYNWYTATAGAGSSSVSSGDVSTSICPKGWKLPAYDGTGSFYNIINGTNGYKSSWTTVNGKSGYKFGYNSNDAFWPAAGGVNSGSLDGAGSYGSYWSRRAGNASDAYRLYFNSSGVNPRNYNVRYYGYSVRCVAAQ